MILFIEDLKDNIDYFEKHLSNISETKTFVSFQDGLNYLINNLDKVSTIVCDHNFLRRSSDSFPEGIGHEFQREAIRFGFDKLFVHFSSDPCESKYQETENFISIKKSKTQDCLKLLLKEISDYE